MINYLNTTKSIIEKIILISLFFSTNTVFAQVMSSGSFKLQSDSLNFGGNRSSSVSYKTESTIGEIGTGDLQGTNYNIKAGYQQGSTSAANVAVVSTTTSTQTNPVSSSSSGSWSVNVSNFTAESHYPSILLTWINPVGFSFDSVRIMRSDKFFPNDPFDGELIYEGSLESVIDNNVKDGVVYYYSIFSRSTRGEFSSGSIAFSQLIKKEDQISTTTGGVSKPIITNRDPFINIPIISDVSPKISNLKLSDFDFIQKGRKLTVIGNTINIDGQENLLISLDYNKVPEVLKTIAITLASPDDPTMVFSFLLRVNPQKTAYEATIAPFGKSGVYGMSITILDYKNQGLKRLKGELTAFSLAGADFFLNNVTKISKTELIIVIIISIICFFVIFRLIRRYISKKHEN